MTPVPSRDDTDGQTVFEGEVLPHVNRLFRLAMWLERNRADAEDVVQDTMIQALKSFHRFQPGTNCRAWLVTILYRIVSNRRRARGRSIVVSDPDDRIAHTVPFVPSVPQVLTDELVLGTLARLPTVYQDVIVLCDVEDLCYKEAAAALAIPIGTVMSRLHRARAQLRARDALGDHRNCGLKLRKVRTPVPLEEAAQRLEGSLVPADRRMVVAWQNPIH
jgi:RNA polymerase sigma-70 factor (ECF subfamily)